MYHPLNEVGFATGTESSVPQEHTIFEESNIQKHIGIIPKHDDDNDPGGLDIPIGSHLNMQFLLVYMKA